MSRHAEGWRPACSVRPVLQGAGAGGGAYGGGDPFSNPFDIFESFFGGGMGGGMGGMGGMGGTQMRNRPVRGDDERWVALTPLALTQT